MRCVVSAVSEYKTCYSPEASIAYAFELFNHRSVVGVVELLVSIALWFTYLCVTERSYSAKLKDTFRDLAG